jgi:hypothetical protein
MPLCGFDKKMLEGLTIFAQSLYEAALRKSREKDITIEKAMEVEIEEMNAFLFALDSKYEEFRKTHDVPESMSRLVSWIGNR